MYHDGRYYTAEISENKNMQIAFGNMRVSVPI